MRFLTSGESHGKGLCAIIDDYPSGVNIDLDFLNNELKRRQSGYGRGKRMQIEDDKLEIMSGIRNGMSLGSPISFLIFNRDWENWKDVMSVEAEERSSITEEKSEKILNPRPGHADFAGFVKYRFDDIRNVIERSSARETAMRVAVGGFAKILLKVFDIFVYSFVEKIGKFEINIKNYNRDLFLEAEKSEVRCPDERISIRMKNEIDSATRNGDTLGGKFTVFVKGLPAGLGSYCQWDRRIDAKIAHAIMSIPAIKAVEIGSGVIAAGSTGLSYHDEIFYDERQGFYRKTNNAGGVEGGVTNGEDLVVSAYMKPIPTTTHGLQTVNLKTKNEQISLRERSDVCAVPSASIIGESMLSIVIVDAIQEKFGRDNITEMFENYKNYTNYLRNI